MANTDYGGLLKNTWEICIQKDNLIVLLVGGLVTAFGSMFTLGVLSGPLTLGFVQTCHKAARGESVEMGDLWNGFSRFGASFVLSVLMLIAMVIGSLACGVGALVAAVFFLYSFNVMADNEDIGAVDAMKESFALAKENLADTVVVILILGVIGSVLSMTGIGSFVFAPFWGVMIALLYNDVGGGAAGPADVL